MLIVGYWVCWYFIYGWCLWVWIDMWEVKNWSRVGAAWYQYFTLFHVNKINSLAQYTILFYKQQKLAKNQVFVCQFVSVLNCLNLFVRSIHTIPSYDGMVDHHQVFIILFTHHIYMLYPYYSMKKIYMHINL